MGFCVVFMYFFSQETSLKNGAVIICLLASKFLSLRIYTQCYTRAGSNCPKTLKQKTKALTCLEQQHETIQLLLQTCSYLGKVLLITANPLLQFTCWSWQKKQTGQYNFPPPLQGLFGIKWISPFIKLPSLGFSEKYLVLPSYSFSQSGCSWHSETSCYL